MLKINSKLKIENRDIDIRFHEAVLSKTPYSEQDLNDVIDLSYDLPEIPKIIELVYPHHIQLIFDLQESYIPLPKKEYYYTKTYIEIIKQSKGGMIIKIVGMHHEKQHFFPKGDNVLNTIQEVFKEINRAWREISFSQML